MAKRRKKVSRHVDREEKQPKAPKPIFTSPFHDLKKLLKQRPDSTSGAKPESAPPPPAAPIAPQPPPDDDTIFAQAFEGVRPLAGARRNRVPIEPAQNRAIVSEDSEVLAALSDLVGGQGEFDITETDEYVEGARVGLDPRLVTRLRRGEFAVQAHLDLHGMIQPAAKDALSAFVLDSTRKGLRTILVIHGRGRRSPGGHPILKHAATEWLSQTSISGYVLAFATARPQDGGAGATYVLLRRDRRRGPFEVLKGAKRRN
jgi:DNA-nicking Smr family endonuclease